MSSVLEGSERLELELVPEPLAGPAAGSLFLHLALVGGALAYAFAGGFFHHSLWGNAGGGGAIQVNLVTSAIPLPSKQPKNDNVLSTDKPSEAPAPPEPKTKQAEDLSAIPIPGKQNTPQKQTTKQSQVKQKVQPYKAYYGEQSGSSMPHAMVSATVGNTSVSDAAFGSLFGWYVAQIDRAMIANGYRSMADPRTPRGAKASISFKIYRDGSMGDARLDQSSGSGSWDRVCLQAAQRVENFGPLPNGYHNSNLQVFYDCVY